MTIAAGVLFLTPGVPKPRALFLKRGSGGDFSGHWCFPGGRQEDGETIEQTAEREAAEEIGFLPKGSRTPLTRSISMPESPAPLSAPSAETMAGEAVVTPPAVSPVDYTTFLQKVPEEFAPKVNGEHVGWAWAPVDEPPQPMHPGCQIALDRLTMDELGVARAMADGRLTSPQAYENVTLFAIRITGTGLAYRRAHDEFVWREPDIYLNDEFLARCNGLPVIFEHPKNALLDSKEFNDRIIGTVLLPYIMNSEVWGIAKVYDRAAIAIMMEDRDDISTSPAVSWRDISVNTVVKTEDGSKLLIEGKPSIVDHIAICSPKGVWDKGGDAQGVRIDAQRTTRSKPIEFPSAKLDLALSKARNLALDEALRSFR